VGDLIHTDVLGAKKIGMGAIFIGPENYDRSFGVKPDYCISSINEIPDLFIC